MNLDDLLEKSIWRMALRISKAEVEMFRIAGDRLAEVGIFTASQAKEYLNSDKYFDDQYEDLNKIKRALKSANDDNISDMFTLYDGITGTVWDSAKSLKDVPGQQFLPFEEIETALKSDKTTRAKLKDALSGYKAMTKSTTVNQTYRKTIGNFLNSMTLDEDRLNFPQAMRKAVRELTEQGISTIEYESGRKVRMDSAVRNALMTEYTEIVQGIERKLAAQIGADGWEISVHEHPAVDHMNIQGHIFTDGEYEKLQNHEPAEDIEGESFQLDRAIGDWNCRHIAFPFLIGISEPSFSKEELADIQARNNAGVDFHGKHYTLYEAEQHQRFLERSMRHERENNNLLKQVRETDPAMESDYQKSKRRLADLRNEYKELGAVLEPKSIRMKMERSYVPKGSTGSEKLPNIKPPPFETREGWSPQFQEKIDKIRDYNSPHDVDIELLETMAKQSGYKSGKEFTNAVNDYIKENQSMARFDLNKTLGHWANDPVWKNSYEITTDENYYLRARNGWESIVAGSPINKDTMTSRERPVYGIMGNKQDMQNGAALGYGESYVVFKESVKSRSTFTIGNSSDRQGAFTSDVSAMFNRDRSEYIDKKAIEGAVQYSNKNLKHQVDSSELSYMETQIWGSIDLRKDVEKIVLGDRDIAYLRKNRVLYNQFKALIGDVLVEDMEGHKLWY